MEEINDPVLRDAVEGKEYALEEIYRRYSGFVFRIALSITKNPPDAEEVTQDVFVSVLKNMKDFRFQSSIRTYLYRITVNTSINYLKKHLGDESYHENTPGESKSWGDPDEELEKRELHTEFLEIIDLLGDELKTCFILKEIEGMKYEEIASILNENVNTVKTRVRRARERLIRELKERYYGVQRSERNTTG